MAITIEELTAHLITLELPVEKRNQAKLVTCLSVEAPDGEAASVDVSIEWLNEGRVLRFSSQDLFNISDLVSDNSNNAKTVMAGLLACVGISSFGAPGVDADLNVQCAYTASLEDTPLSLRQLKRILTGLVKGIEVALKAGTVHQGSQEDMAHSETETRPESRLAAGMLELYRKIDRAIMVMERRQGSPEEQGAAWTFIETALKPGNLPAEDQEKLRRIVLPIFRLEASARPVW